MDDVLQAQAIMLLAGTGNAWQASSNYNMVGGANRGSRPFVSPSGGANQQPMSKAFFPAPQPSTPASSAGAPATPPDRPVPAAGALRCPHYQFCDDFFYSCDVCHVEFRG